MTPIGLAWANLRHKFARTLIAAAGVGFAVVLTFMEMGMYGGVERTATMLHNTLRFDLLLISSEYLDLTRPDDMPRTRLAQARGVEGVAEVVPLSLGVGEWRQPGRTGWPWDPWPRSGEVNSISIIAVPPDRLIQAFTIGPDGAFKSAEEAAAAGAKLAQLDTFLFDRLSRSEFGTVEELRGLPPEGRELPHGGREAVRLNGLRAEVVGGFELGTGFSWNAMLVCSEATFSRFTMWPTDRVNFGLVTLSAGADTERVKQKLIAELPADVRVVDRDEITALERRYWTKLTSVGQFLLVAVVLAVVVGVIFLYQMMAADIRSMLPEYATVKALGYPAGFLSGVVLWQSLLLAVLGYIPGFAAALGLYWVARTWGGIPCLMKPGIALGVLALTCGMCLASGLLAVRKVHAADPADLF